MPSQQPTGCRRYKSTGGEQYMNRGARWWAILAAIVFSVTAFSNLHSIPGRKQTFTGDVGDAMCGRKHMDGPAADCTRSCVPHGPNSALLLSAQLSTLHTPTH